MNASFILEKDWSGPTVSMSFILFIIWMQRNNRWRLFVDCLAGQYAISGSRVGDARSGSASNPSGKSSGTSGAPTKPGKEGEFADNGSYFFHDGKWVKITGVEAG